MYPRVKEQTQHELHSKCRRFFYFPAKVVVFRGNMFIEKNGRNCSFGQPTIKGWSYVSPTRLIALTISETLLRKNAGKMTRSYLNHEYLLGKGQSLHFYALICLKSDWDILD